MPPCTPVSNWKLIRIHVPLYIELVYPTFCCNIVCLSLLLFYVLGHTDNCKLLQCDGVCCLFCLGFQTVVAALIGVLYVYLVNVS